MIEELAKLIPNHLLEMSGAVFYSGRNAFRSTSSLYILGANPGGDSDSTIRSHTKKVLQVERDDWSAYRDESWKNSDPGASRMQRRILYMINRAGLSPGDVPASNVVFVRTRRQSDLDFGHHADACWPFHQMAMKQLKPRVVLCLGVIAGNHVRNKLGASIPVGKFEETNNRRWRSRSFRNSAGVTVVVLTHPSIADWTAPDTDPCHLVIDALRS